ncbi:MAG: Hsp20/alpha crystallin family protein [Pirellulaceae bacterium]
MRMVFPNNMTGRFLDDLASEMNTFVESVLGDEAKATGTTTGAAFKPRMDVHETETAVVLSLDLPGVDPDTVSIEVVDDQLLVQGERVRQAVDESATHHRVERSFGAFSRGIALAPTIDRDAIVADYQHGVLTITLPKAVEDKKSRRIVISQTGNSQTGNS